jgi:8-oxo-dGTP diphosphatase
MINVVCAVIQDESNRVLVCQRPEGKALAGKWEFPGGKIEPEERPEDALRREILEELGCDIEVGEAMAEVEYHYAGFSIRLMPYRGKIISGMPTAVEHAELRWLALDECVSLDWAEADVPIWKSLAGCLAGD